MLYSKNCGFHTFRAFVHANFKSLEFDWATMIASAPGSMRTLILPTTQPMQPWKDLLSWWSLVHHWDGICNCKTWWKLVVGGCLNLISACVELLIYFRMAPNWLVMLLVFLCRAELHTSPEHPLMGCSPRQHTTSVPLFMRSFAQTSRNMRSLPANLFGQFLPINVSFDVLW